MIVNRILIELSQYHNSRQVKTDKANEKEKVFEKDMFPLNVNMLSRQLLDHIMVSPALLHLDESPVPPVSGRISAGFKILNFLLLLI